MISQQILVIWGPWWLLRGLVHVKVGGMYYSDLGRKAEMGAQS